MVRIADNFTKTLLMPSNPSALKTPLFPEHSGKAKRTPKMLPEYSGTPDRIRFDFPYRYFDEKIFVLAHRRPLEIQNELDFALRSTPAAFSEFIPTFRSTPEKQSIIQLTYLNQ